MPIATTAQRKSMLKLLIEDVPKAEIIDYEIKNDPPSYTWLTIQFLKTKFNPKKITMVIGADQLSRLDRWKDINTGKRAGCKTIFIDKKYNEKLRNKPDYLVKNLFQLKKIFKFEI